MSADVEELWGPDEERALLDSIDAWVEKSVAPIARVPASFKAKTSACGCPAFG